MNNLTTFINGIGKLLYGENMTETNHRRLLCFLALTLIEVVILPYYMLGNGGRQDLPFQLAAYAQALIFVITETGAWSGKMDLKTSLLVLLATIYSRLLLETVFYIAGDSNVAHPMIIGNMVMLVAATLFAIIIRLRILPLVESIATIVCFILCILVPKNRDLAQTGWYFGIIFCATLLLSIINYRQLGRERRWESKINDMNPEEVKVIDLLSTTQNLGIDKTESLIDRLGTVRREQIVENVSSYLNQDNVLIMRLEKLCPDLTNTEMEISKLILKGKTLKEICAELNKSESTVSTHRCHIRKKLGIKREDNLVRFLQKHA